MLLPSYISGLMRISVLDLRRGASAFAAELTAGQLELPVERFPGPIRLEVKVHEQDSGWLLELSVRAAWHRDCDRCLGEAISESQLAETLLVLDKGHQDAETMADQDRVMIVEDDDAELDLLPSVREALLLDQPDYVLCSEQCLGLCPNCGCNWNETECACDDIRPDSPFAGLEKLKTDETE